VLRDYERQRNEGIEEPVFHRQVLKKPDEVEPGIWD
jgi:AGCS family alanine or glycine:cation symporter